MFEKYDSWRQAEYSSYVKTRTACSEVDHGCDPVAFFSFDDNQNEAKVYVDVCSIGQYVLVKFLEPRQPCAERLGIVGIKFYGYDRKAMFVETVCTVEKVSLGSESVPADIVCLKTLLFLDGLVRDQCKMSVKTGKLPSLDLIDTSVKEIWDVFRAFQDSNTASIIIMHLLHALLPYLVRASTKTDQEATDAFFQQLCNIVDDASHDSADSSILLEVTKAVITDGAAIFFPDRDSRSKQLFQLIKDINAPNERRSVTLKFQSLCHFFSKVDPSGLLGLPSTPSKSFDPSSVLSIMDTLLSVSHRECIALMDTVTQCSDKLPHLIHLLCSLQTSLFSWCSQQIEAEKFRDIAQTVLVQYVSLMAAKVTASLEKFCDCTEEQMVAALKFLDSSMLSSTFPQLILLLNNICDNLTTTARIVVLDAFQPLTKQLNAISVKLPKVFHAVDSDYWFTMERPEEVLKVWEVESVHKYENNQHTTQLFTCPGAMSFLVEFDPRCETERRYDYLEFTDSTGVKTRYDHKVNTDKWPLIKIFNSGPRLQFLFHSDSSTNEWGYKFRVSARGRCDEPLCWLHDAYLSLSKLVGKLCGANLDTSSTLAKTSLLAARDDVERELAMTEMRLTLFRGGRLSESAQNKPANDSVELHAVARMVKLADEDAARLLDKVREHHRTSSSTQSIGGADVDEAVCATFAALVWHSEALHEEISKYAEKTSLGDGNVSEGVHQAYAAAEGLRSFLVEERQKIKASKEKSADQTKLDPVPMVKKKALYLLEFAGLSKLHLKAEKLKFESSVSKATHNSGNKILKVDPTCEKYPSFRLVLEFLRDSSWTIERVEQLLKSRSEHARSASHALKFVHEFVAQTGSHGSDLFQIQTVMLLQELLHYQDKFGRHYSDGVVGCGPELELAVRQAYYDLIVCLVESIRKISRHQMQRCQLSCFDVFVASAVHLLDVQWQLTDLKFLEEQNIPEFFYKLFIDTIAIPESVEVQCDDAKELENYKTFMTWLEESKPNFSAWYDRQTKDRQVQTFIARYCSVLEVTITCDGCGVLIPGQRYRCLDCTDIDLCSSCFFDGILPSTVEHKVSHSIVHFEYKCDGCQGFIVGTRIHCDECQDFDLCLCCQNSSRYPEGHKASHSVTEYPPVKLRLNSSTYSPVQSYVHQHVWLQYSSLALTVASVVYGHNHAMADPEQLATATKLYQSVVDLSSGYLDNLCSHQLHADVSDESDGANVLDPSEAMFSIHSQEKVSGLLGALIPSATSKSAVLDDICHVLASNDFIKVLFSVLQGEYGHDGNSQHFAFGLIRQLLLNVPKSFQIIDSMLELEEYWASYSSEKLPPGVHTVHFLFVFGSTCLERFGLEWASSAVMLLRQLLDLPAWTEAVSWHLSTCLSRLSEDCSPGSIFALFVIAGFPYMMSLGSQVQYTDSGLESQSGIIVKHFDNRNESVVVNKKTRQRKRFKDSKLMVITSDTCCITESQIPLFVNVVVDIAGKLKSDESVSLETVWVLALALKSLVKVTRKYGCQQISQLFEPEFVQAISHLSVSGTGFSRGWLVTDLEILLLTLYGKRQRLKSGDVVASSVQVKPPSDHPPAQSGCCDPLEGLSELARQTFQTLHDHLKIKFSVLRAYYEQVDHDTQTLIAILHASSFSANEDFMPVDKDERKTIMELAKKWEKPQVANTEVVSDMDIDDGIQLSSVSSSEWPKTETASNFADETVDEVHQTMIEDVNDAEQSIRTQRQCQSSSLLRKELSNNQPASNNALMKINRAVAVMYARQVLISLLADWPTTDHMISEELIGCCSSENLPYILDLLSRTESLDMSKKVVRNVIQNWQPDGFKSIAQVACDFMSEVGSRPVICESSHILVDDEDDENDHTCEITERVVIPGAAYLRVTFDPRCCTEENGDELVISRSADFKVDRHVFGGIPNYWANFDLHGNTLHYKFLSDYIGSDWGFKFTVTGIRVGRFDTGYLILDALLTSRSAAGALQIDKLWHHLITIACRQTGQHRLKTIHLLLTLLNSQSQRTGECPPAVDLGLLAPLWQLHRKMYANSADVTCIVSSVVRALTELFYVAENLAMEWNIVAEYVATLSGPKIIMQSLHQGIKNVAALSCSINYEISQQKK